MAVHDLQSLREGIATRIREDYGLDFGTLSQDSDESIRANRETDSSAPESPVLAPAEAQKDIEELKRKLARLGSVNMEALEELTRVETESNLLRDQHEDLNSARKSLEDVIDAINSDSRKLFGNAEHGSRHFRIVPQTLRRRAGRPVLEDGTTCWSRIGSSLDLPVRSCVRSRCCLEAKKPFDIALCSRSFGEAEPVLHSRRGRRALERTRRDSPVYCASFSIKVSSCVTHRSGRWPQPTDFGA